MQIYKWKLEMTDRQTLMLPVGAKLLDVQMQKEDCCLWALCDDNAKKEPRHIAIYGTGNPFQVENSNYLSTFQMPKRGLVFHVFEVYSA